MAILPENCVAVMALMGIDIEFRRMFGIALRRSHKMASALKCYNLAPFSTAAQAEVKKAGPFKTLDVTVAKPFVYHVQLNRPDKLNAMNSTMWLEIEQCFNELSENSECRVVVLSGSGKLFTSGLDFSDAGNMVTSSDEDDIARRSITLRKIIKKYQDSMTSLEKCTKPVICAIHSACIGGGVNLITAADIRLCSNDAWFQVKEVALGMAADVGVLQRLPKVIGNDSLARELAFTARKLFAAEAKECGLVSKVFDSKQSLFDGALQMAEEIAVHSPVAVQLTKRAMVYSRDHTVEDSLDYIANWNMTMLHGEDFRNAVVALITKSPIPKFSKL